MPSDFSFVLPEVPPLEDSDTYPSSFLDLFNQLCDTLCKDSLSPEERAGLKKTVEDLWTSPIQTPEQILNEHPNLLDKKHLKALMQIYCKARTCTLQLAQKNKTIETESDQVRFLLETERRLIFINKIILAVEKSFYDSDLQSERSIIFTSLHQDIKTILDNISSAFFAKHYQDYRNALKICFDDIWELGFSILLEVPIKIKKSGSNLDRSCLIKLLSESLDWDLYHARYLLSLDRTQDVLIFLNSEEAQLNSYVSKALKYFDPSNDSYQTNYQVVQTKLQTIKEDILQAKQNTLETLKETLACLEETNRKLKLQHLEAQEALSAQQEASKKVLGQIKQDLQRLVSNNNALEQQLKAKTITKTEQQIIALENEITPLKVQKSTLTEYLDSKTFSIAQQRTEQDHKGKLETLTENKTKLSLELKSYKATLQQLQEKVKKARDQEAQRLQAIHQATENKKRTEKVQSLTQILQDLQLKNSQLNAAKQPLEAELEKLVQEKQRLATCRDFTVANQERDLQGALRVVAQLNRLQQSFPPPPVSTLPSDVSRRPISTLQQTHTATTQQADPLAQYRREKPKLQSKK